MTTGAAAYQSRETLDRRLTSTRKVLRWLFSRSIRSLRKQSGNGRRVTQKELAARMGMSTSQLSYLETGRRPLTDKNLARILVALDLNPIDFLAAAASLAASKDEQVVAQARRRLEAAE